MLPIIKFQSFIRSHSTINNPLSKCLILSHIRSLLSHTSSFDLFTVSRRLLTMAIFLAMLFMLLSQTNGLGRDLLGKNNNKRHSPPPKLKKHSPPTALLGGRRCQHPSGTPKGSCPVPYECHCTSSVICKPR